MRVLVTGATGYIGGRLVPKLLDAGHDVRVLVRDRAKLGDRPWSHQVEVVEADLLAPASLPEALEGIEAAYYLVHAMGAGKGFEAADRAAARAFVEAGQELGLCVYLGGLKPRGASASHHLASRAEVGEILRAGLPTTEFRAGPIIGAGSASYEMLAHLTDRLPVMVAPRWIDNRIQPIAIDDVLSYLVAALDQGPQGVVEIGAADVSTFREMMQTYADVRGLKRLIFKVPVLTPHLAGLWVQLVTPIPNRIAVPLIEGIIQDLVADTSLARKRFPGVEPMAYREAVELALADGQASGPVSS